MVLRCKGGAVLLWRPMAMADYNTLWRTMHTYSRMETRTTVSLGCASGAQDSLSLIFVRRSGWRNSARRRTKSATWAQPIMMALWAFVRATHPEGSIVVQLGSKWSRVGRSSCESLSFLSPVNLRFAHTENTRSSARFARSLPHCVS